VLSGKAANINFIVLNVDLAGVTIYHTQRIVLNVDLAGALTHNLSHSKYSLKCRPGRGSNSQSITLEV